MFQYALNCFMQSSCSEVDPMQKRTCVLTSPSVHYYRLIYFLLSITASKIMCSGLKSGKNQCNQAHETLNVFEGFFENHVYYGDQQIYLQYWSKFLSTSNLLLLVTCTIRLSIFRWFILTSLREHVPLPAFPLPRYVWL